MPPRDCDKPQPEEAPECKTRPVDRAVEFFHKGPPRFGLLGEILFEWNVVVWMLYALFSSRKYM